MSRSPTTHFFQTGNPSRGLAMGSLVAAFLWVLPSVTFGQEALTEPVPDDEAGPAPKVGRLGQYPDNAQVRRGDFERSITIPGTGGSFRIGGFVRVLVSFDIDNAGVPTNALPFAVPLDGSSADARTQLGFDVRDTQVNFDFRRPTDLGLFRTFVEMDFFGSGSEVDNTFGVRLRHAAAGLGGLQVGQFWTQFMDLKAIPESADLLGPYGAPVLRTPGIRWFQGVGDNFTWGVSLENPGDDLTGEPDQDVADSIPNLVGFVELNGDFGHVHVSGLGMRLDAEDDEAFTGAVSIMARIRLPLLDENDNLTLGGQYGGGFAYYYAGFADLGLSGVIGSDGSVDPTEVLTAHVSLQKWWTSRLRSTVHVSFLDIDAAEGTEGDTISESIKVVGNVFWSPLDDATFGLEVIYITREDVSGDDGDGLRLAAVTQFNF